MDIIRDLEQGSPEWFALRAGSIGGSGIKKATSKGRGKAPSKTRTGYLYKKADEVMTGEVILDTYKSYDMVLGTDSEPFSRDAYVFITDNPVEQVAMVKGSKHKHSSPDGLINNDGMGEIKNTNGPNYIETISKDRVPPEHSKQIQWGLSNCEREWCDFILACWIRKTVNGEELIVPRYEGIPIWVKRVYRDEKLIAELQEGADRFIEEMYELTRRINEISRRG